MTDAEIAMIGGAGTVVLGGFASLLKWTAGLWATVQRERIDADTARSKADRESDERRNERQVEAIDRINNTVNDHTTRDIDAQSEVKAAVVRLESKFDAAIDWIERTPVGDNLSPSDKSERRRRVRLRTINDGNPTR